MAYETGHSRNVERFAQMITFVNGYGAVYDPSNAAIEFTALEEKLADALMAIDGVTSALAPWKVVVNDRQSVYDGIRRLTTRVVNSFEASGASKNAVEDVRTLKGKIDGTRAKTLPDDDPNTPENEAAGASVSRQSYTQLSEHLDNLIALLDESGKYNPNESDLQIASLTTYVASLKNANTAVDNAAVPLANSRIARDEVLYARDTGLVDLAALVKKYVKSLYGADSPQFKQISGLEFTRPR